jgi:hypothetical protein
MTDLEQKLKALSAFKDWSNYLLVTTVAAIGWTTSEHVCFASPTLKATCVIFLALSVVFAILTLALIPHVGEDLREGDKSIYSVRWHGWMGSRFELMDFCFWQHLLFLLGVLVYAGATTFTNAWVGFGVSVGLALFTVAFLRLVVWRTKTRG